MKVYSRAMKKYQLPFNMSLKLFHCSVLYYVPVLFSVFYQLTVDEKSCIVAEIDHETYFRSHHSCINVNVPTFSILFYFKERYSYNKYLLLNTLKWLTFRSSNLKG